MAGFSSRRSQDCCLQRLFCWGDAGWTHENTIGCTHEKFVSGARSMAFAWYVVRKTPSRARHSVRNARKKNAAQGRNHWRSISAEERRKIIQCKVEQKRARRKQRESMGLCVVCGKRKAIKGKKHCLECLLKARRANRAQYDAKRVKTNFSEGLCCKCNDPVVPGKKVCARHYDIARRSMEAA